MSPTTQFFPVMNHRCYALARQVGYLSGEQNYTWTFLLSGYRDIRRGPLWLVAQYYPSFLRIHKQYVINPDYLMAIHVEVRPLKRPVVNVELLGGTRLPIAQARLAGLLPRLKAIVQRNRAFGSNVSSSLNRCSTPFVL